MVTSVGGNRLRWCTQRAGVKAQVTFEERAQKLLLPICPEFQRVPVGRIVYLTAEQREAMIPTVRKQVRAAIRKEERKTSVGR